MTRTTTILVCALLLLFGAHPLVTAQTGLAASNTNALEIFGVSLDGEPVSLAHEGRVRLKPFPKNLAFIFGPTARPSVSPTRLRYKLEGHDDAWHEDAGEMSLTVRWFDAAGDQMGQQIFTATGESGGWKGGLNSPMTHRRETLVVPPRAARLWVILSSAGPPTSLGIFVVDDLVVSRITSSNSVEVLLRFPFDRQPTEDEVNLVPDGWIRDGTHPSMAKIIDLGANPSSRAFAILDDDPAGHAEWHNIMSAAPRVTPGDHLVVEWNEMFSLGLGSVHTVNYESLAPGEYRFRVAAATPMGVPTGQEISLPVFVAEPYWREPWFWSLMFVMVALVIVAISRSVTRYRMRQEMIRLQNQRALEQERLRIAHDIHDDLGARVTQISLLSAMAHDNPAFPEKARQSFNQISRMSRDLVSALYQTVWAVNPENDNLDALGSYLCQMANQLCDQAQLSCRLYVADLPREIRISSQTRHNISMAVKEAVHNVIKHANASEIQLRIALDGLALSVSVQDDGSGFSPSNDAKGNGLNNMKRRMESIGGMFAIESEPGKGTKVRLRLVLKPLD